MSNVNHPSHYTNREHECIDEMIAMFGKHDEDMEKADWYIRKAMDLQKNNNDDWSF